MLSSPRAAARAWAIFSDGGGAVEPGHAARPPGPRHLLRQHDRRVAGAAAGDQRAQRPDGRTARAEHPVVDLAQMARAADDQPLRLVPRVAPRIGIGLVLRGEPGVGCVGHARRHRPPPWLKPDRAAISASASRGCRNRPMSAPCCAPRTPSAPRSASSSAPAWTPAPAASPTPPTRRSMCRCGASRSVEAMALPQRCVLVGVELLDDATDLPSFRHPVNAAYVLGPERSGLSPAMLRRCRHVVRIPTRFALNLAVAGALVLYDRLLQHGRFAERPVGSRGAAASLPAPAAGTARRAFAATSRTGWQARPSHDAELRALVACLSVSRRISPAMRLIACFCSLSSLPCRPVRTGAAEAGEAHKAARRGTVRRRLASSRTGPPRRMQESGQTVCYAFVAGKEFRAGVARPRRSRS